MTHIHTVLFAAAMLLPLGAMATPKQLTKTITWEITDTTLNICGKGKMPDFGGKNAPWSYSNVGLPIREIIISEGITSIGDESFVNPTYNQENITGERREGGLQNVVRVHLPTTITRIGAKAFQGLNISYINIPASVTEICAQAFNLSGLRHISLPSGLKRLGFGAFESCVNLESIDFNNAKINLPAGALFDCEQLYIVLNSANITDVHELAIGSTPLEKSPDILALFAASNVDRTMATCLMPWGEYIDKFLPNPPNMTEEEKNVVKRKLKEWERSPLGRKAPKVTRREMLDALYMEIAETDPVQHAEYLTNHQTINSRYEADMNKVLDDYFKTLNEAHSAMFRLDEFTLEPYNKSTGNFIIRSAHHGSFIVSMDADSADDFCNHWHEISRSARAGLVNKADGVLLRNAIFSFSDGRAFAAAPLIY